MKLKVGMYVRTEWGINKIKDIVLNGGLYEDSGLIFENGKLCCGKETMKELRASNYIIDLIEVGDYVNGCYVEDVKETFVNIATGSNYFQRPSIFEEDIKSIVTKEQFESIEYSLEG